MSGLGMLATALAGGAQQIGQIAANDVQNQQRLDLAREQAQIEEQMRMRLSEFQADLTRRSDRNRMADTRDFNASDETIAASRKVAMAAGDTARAVKTAELTDEGLNTAARGKARGDALAASETERDVIKAKAGDAGYLSSMSKIKLADPEVAAHIAQMKASANASAAAAGASAAHAGLLRAQTVGVALTNDDQKRLNDIYDGMGNVLADPKLDESERARKLNELQQRATLIQGRSGKNASPRDPELNTTTTETTKMLPDGTTVKTTAKEVRKPGGEKDDKAPYPDGTELRGKDGKTYVVQNGQPVLKDAAAKPAAKPTPTRPAADDMTGITFSGDGYKFNGVTYPTPAEAKAARDKARGGDNPMSKTLNRYGDD